NEAAKDLWDTLERQMRGSEYGEHDRKATILYEYETFKAIEGEQLLDTYLRYLQVINDLKKCGYMKDNYELNYKFLNNLQPEWKQYGDVNDALGYKKKVVVVTSDPLALVVEKTKVNKQKEKVVVSSDSEGSGADDFSKLKKITTLLAKAFNQKFFYSKPTNNNLRTSSTSQSANKKQEFVKSDDKKEDKKADEKKRDMSKMESSRDSDQEINANMVFMAQIKKVISESDESSSSAEETIAEVAYCTSKSESEYEFQTSEYFDNSTNYGLFVNNDDDQEIFHDAIESASENFIEYHIDSQKDYDNGISILLAVGTPSTGSGNLYYQWELSPGSGNALCILFPTKSSHKAKIEELESRVEKLKEENRRNHPNRGGKLLILILMQRLTWRTYTIWTLPRKEILSMQDVIDVDVKEVDEEMIEVIEIAKIIVDEVSTAGGELNAANEKPVSVVPTNITTAQPSEATKITVDITTAPKAKGIVFHDKEESTKRTTFSKSQVKDKGKAKLVEEPKIQKSRKAQIEIDEDVARRIEAESKDGCKRLKLQEREQEKKVEKDQTVKKQKGDELEQDNTKKQKLEEHQEAEELKKNLEIVPDDEDDEHFQIIRANGNHQMYLAFSTMLKNFDREHLKVLWKIVKDRYNESQPKEVLDILLWHTLKQMFNEVRLQVDYKVEMACDLLRLIFMENIKFKEGLLGYKVFIKLLLLVIMKKTLSDIVMSDSEDSMVTYTEVSSPFEDLSDIGSPRVVFYGYDGLLMHPPSPNYVPGPEHPPSHDYVPGLEHPPSPINEPYVLEPAYPKYMPPEDDS
nr:hypothetical protein [Tanacetum cinerariifolium]